MYGHSATLIASLGRCAADPKCREAAVITDDDNPNKRRCARHAREHIAATQGDTP